MIAKKKYYFNLLIRVLKRLIFGPFDNFLKNTTGIIHIGANIGQERNHYKKYKIKKIVWVEPDPNTFRQLKKNIKPYKNQKELNYLLSDKKKITKFNISNFGGNASSIFDFSTHKEMHPQVKFINKILLTSSTFIDMIEKEKIKLKDYNTLVLDTQGSELLILKGAAKVLNEFKYIKLETSDFEIYKNAPTLKVISRFLNIYNFVEIKKIKIDENKNGGKVFDILYSKKEIIAN
jgi:FkbM family methyltransferase